MRALPFELQLALRYLRPKRTFVSVITLISIIGVMLGVAVLIIVISVMTGFDRELRDKILGFNPHLKVPDYTGRPIRAYDKLSPMILSNDHVRAVAPYILKQGFVQTQPEYGDPQYAAQYVRGIDPDLEESISVLPTSVVDAMAKNEILQIVVFAVFFGVGTAAIGEKGDIVIQVLDSFAHVILKVTAYIMNFAPLAVFGAMTAIIAKQGLDILGTYLIFIAEFYSGLLLLWLVLLLAGSVFIRKRIFTLLRHIREPIVLAFSTSSSEAAFPKTLMELERFGCRDKIVAFVLPLGYSFNLDGSMMYMTFASLAIAQAYGIDLPLSTQLTMLLVLMLTSKGIAGVPRASLVVVLATCAMFDIPPEGVALILPIDHFCDMFRTATNVVGNALATSVVSKWEGELGE